MGTSVRPEAAPADSKSMATNAKSRIGELKTIFPPRCLPNGGEKSMVNAKKMAAREELFFRLRLLS
jgi:hypothetical protein